MRILKLSVALGLMAASLGLTTAASAQNHDDRRGRMEHVERRGEARRDNARRDDRRYQQPRRHETRRGHGYKQARHCRTVWRHHRRVRVCR
jgi:hypothetical protein